MVGPLKPHRAERAPPVALMKGANNSKTFFARLHHWHATVWPGANIPVVLAIVILALALWWLAPSGLASDVWQLFVLFMCTIIGAILEPLPLSAVCLISIGVVSATGVLTTSEMLSGFSSPSVWLIMFASFFASGFVVTGLGKRMCFIILKYAGSTTVGLGYGICFCELILALAIPANSARGVGVMMPILVPLMKEAFQSDPELDTAKRIGSYIVLVEITANATVAACWLTGGAWNALMLQFMKEVGVELSWIGWAYSQAPVALVSLILVPLVMLVLVKPEIRRTPEAPVVAHSRLEAMGPLRTRVMDFVFDYAQCLPLLNDRTAVLVAEEAGVSAQVVCRALAWSTVCGHLTPYTSSANPAYYGLGYVTAKQWWAVGAIVMVLNLVNLVTIGFGYWWLLGYWQ
ncbi:hypothetical protein FOZ60_015549 [Perkinsus olseni]|uniref:Uncharacterized protein n=1 Tax=Perkinsus olseni TaxID=32597 RepID=A0A7J6P5U9_PEROL|nr:hypothetical protein FOZ60_015549 [Perkinsus olseni]